MSVQFGRWNFDGRTPRIDDLKKIRAELAAFGPDGNTTYLKDGTRIQLHALHTTAESRRARQPYISTSGSAVFLDGRIDNRSELAAQLGDVTCGDSADIALVTAAYERWGTRCFANLIGDWAITIWNPGSKTLILAKDFVGTHSLFYSCREDHVLWSSILGPLVLLSEKDLHLNEEYLAGCFSLSPAAHLTPYREIHSVPPASFVLLTPEKQTVTKFWDFDPRKTIHYRTDAEYEEHFRVVFSESVRRRLRSDSPILSELSGGMDSSAIVCMADTIFACGEDVPRVDTLSYYDDSEPNWNERPFFSKVEEQRGRKGFHINLDCSRICDSTGVIHQFASTPGSLRNPSEAQRRFTTRMVEQGYRVVLSGVGGDEVTGGVPTPTPELQDLLVQARFRKLARQLKLWSLNKRKPWVHLLSEAVRTFLPLYLVGVPKHCRPVSWLNRDFVSRNHKPLTGYMARSKVFGLRPTFQENIAALNVLRRQLGCESMTADPPYERRYPYLDRDLLEFLYAVPREQLVRPGHRRSLMRRALVGIVPAELLNRRRKAFVVRSPMKSVSSEWPSLIEMAPNMVSTKFGIVNAEAFCAAVQDVRQGKEIPIAAVMRTLGIELWLRHLRDQGLFQENDLTSVPGMRLLSVAGLSSTAML
jgi:asparagine synthase (glutamine-hydrolysing)